MACCSDRKTVHVYNVSTGLAQSQMIDNSTCGTPEKNEQKDEEDKKLVKNTKSKLKVLSSLMPYYGKEFSFCQLQCQDGSSE